MESSHANDVQKFSGTRNYQVRLARMGTMFPTLVANRWSHDGGRGRMSMKLVNNLNHMRVISRPLADVKRIAGVGKGTPAEVLEPEVQTVLREKSLLVVDHRDLRVGLDRHVQ